MHPSAFKNNTCRFHAIVPEAAEWYHGTQSPASETGGGRWFGFTGWGKARNRKPGVAPCRNPKCLQSLKLDSLLFNPVLVFEGGVDRQMIFFQLSFLNILILSLLFDVVGSSSCMQKARRHAWKRIIQGTQKQLFDRLLLFLLTPGKCRDLAPRKSHSGLLSQMLYTGISRRLLLYLCGLTRLSLWPRALECQQRLAVIARKCTVCQIIV